MGDSDFVGEGYNNNIEKNDLNTKVRSTYVKNGKGKKEGKGRK